MNRSVSPVNGFSVPPAAAVSNSRTDVVPTATTRPPRWRQARICATASGPIVPHSASQLVLGQRRGGDRPERARPDVQRQPAELTPCFLQASEQGFAEVQSGRGGRHRPRIPRIDRLVMLAVGLDHLAFADVRRQGDPADPFQQRKGLLVRLRARQSNCRRPAWPPSRNEMSSGPGGVEQDDRLAGAQAGRGPCRGSATVPRAWPARTAPPSARPCERGGPTAGPEPPACRSAPGNPRACSNSGKSRI